MHHILSENKDFFNFDNIRMTGMMYQDLVCQGGNMLFLAYLLLAIGACLVLAELFSTWRLCRYGPYNANMMFQVFLSFSLFPTRIILAVGVTLLIWVKFAWSWQFAVAAVTSFFIVDGCLYVLQIPVTYSYRKKLRENDMIAEKIETARRLGLLKDAEPAVDSSRVQAEVVSQSEFLRYEERPPRKRRQATVRKPSAS